MYKRVHISGSAIAWETFWGSVIVRVPDDATPDYLARLCKKARDDAFYNCLVMWEDSAFKRGDGLRPIELDKEFNAEDIEDVDDPTPAELEVAIESVADRHILKAFQEWLDNGTAKVDGTPVDLNWFVARLRNCSDIVPAEYC